MTGPRAASQVVAVVTDPAELAPAIGRALGGRVGAVHTGV